MSRQPTLVVSWRQITWRRSMFASSPARRERVGLGDSSSTNTSWPTKRTMFALVFFEVAAPATQPTVTLDAPIVGAASTSGRISKQKPAPPASTQVTRHRGPTAPTTTTTTTTIRARGDNRDSVRPSTISIAAASSVVAADKPEARIANLRGLGKRINTAGAKNGSSGTLGVQQKQSVRLGNENSEVRMVQRKISSASPTIGKGENNGVSISSSSLATTKSITQSSLPRQLLLSKRSPQAQQQINQPQQQQAPRDLVLEQRGVGEHWALFNRPDGHFAFFEILVLVSNIMVVSTIVFVILATCLAKSRRRKRAPLESVDSKQQQQQQQQQQERKEQILPATEANSGEQDSLGSHWQIGSRPASSAARSHTTLHFSDEPPISVVGANSGLSQFSSQLKSAAELPSELVEAPAIVASGSGGSGRITSCAATLSQQTPVTESVITASVHNNHHNNAPNLQVGSNADRSILRRSSVLDHDGGGDGEHPSRPNSHVVAEDQDSVVPPGRVGQARQMAREFKGGTSMATNKAMAIVQPSEQQAHMSAASTPSQEGSIKQKEVAGLSEQQADLSSAATTTMGSTAWAVDSAENRETQRQQALESPKDAQRIETELANGKRSPEKNSMPTPDEGDSSGLPLENKRNVKINSEKVVEIETTIVPTNRQIEESRTTPNQVSDISAPTSKPIAAPPLSPTESEQNYASSKSRQQARVTVPSSNGNTNGSRVGIRAIGIRRANDSLSRASIDSKKELTILENLQDGEAQNRKYFVYSVHDGQFAANKECIARIELPPKRRITLSELRQIIANSPDHCLLGLRRNRFKFVTETYRLLTENEDAAILHQVYPTQGVFLKISLADQQDLGARTYSGPGAQPGTYGQAARGATGSQFGDSSMGQLPAIEINYASGSRATSCERHISRERRKNSQSTNTIASFGRSKSNIQTGVGDRRKSSSSNAWLPGINDLGSLPDELVEKCRAFTSTPVADMTSDRMRIITPSNYCSRASCGRLATIKCAICNHVHYCGTQCRTRDWPMHKLFCKKPRWKVSGASH